MSSSTPSVTPLVPRREPRQHRVHDAPRVDGFAVSALAVTVDALAIVLGAAPLLLLATLCVHDCARSW